MTVFRNSAQGGSDGVDVTPANSGGASGNAWSSVDVSGAANRLTFSDDHAAHGTMAYRLIPAPGSTSGFAYGLTTFPATDRAAVSFYVLAPAASSPRSIVSIRHGAGNAASLRLTAANELQVLNAAGTQVFLSGPLTPGTWYRVELRVIRGTTITNGTIEFAYYFFDPSGDSGAISSFLSAAQNAGTTDVVSVRLGHNVTGLTGIYTGFWMDSIQVKSAADANALIGPWMLERVRVWTPTAEELLDLNGVRRRVDGFRYELLDRNLQRIGELHPMVVQDPVIENDADSDTSRRLRGLKLKPDEQVDVNPLTDRVRVWMVLQNGVEYLLGTFMWADASRPQRSWGIEQDAELVDRTLQLDQGALRAHSWGRGGTITLIMYYLCFRAGLKQEEIAVIGPAADRGLTEPMAWEPGSTWLRMLQDLCNVVGFAKPWFDRYGLLHLSTPQEPELGQPTCRYAIDGSPGTRIVADSILLTSDELSAPNAFGVYESGSGATKVGTYAIPSSAPHSFANIGFWRTIVESVQGLTNQTQATNAARKLARTRAIAYEWLQFESTLDPRHDTYDVVQALDRNWLETAWTMPLRSGGRMQHKMRRVSYEL
jgi:hypothetical protein